MKSDKYIKVILTIIAICLMWICIRDIKIGGNYLFAGNSNFSNQETIPVHLVDSSAHLSVHVAEISHVYGRWDPIHVMALSPDTETQEKNSLPH